MHEKAGHMRRKGAVRVPLGTLWGRARELEVYGSDGAWDANVVDDDGGSGVFDLDQAQQMDVLRALAERVLGSHKSGAAVALQAHLDAVREALPADLLLAHDGYPHSAVQALVARVAELEKRLQRVREWRVFSEAPFPEIAALGRILDAKETP